MSLELKNNVRKKMEEEARLRVANEHQSMVAFLHWE
jgi:hypothetical protein